MSKSDSGTPAAIVDFQPLIAWLERQCDDSWEHRHGVRLETLDNPGWMLTIDLQGTELDGKQMREVREGLAPAGHPVAPRWLHCHIEGKMFRGACDPSQVARLFHAFESFRRGTETV